MTNAIEGPAYGVALLAGVGSGAWKSVEEACKSAIKSVSKIRPVVKQSNLYDKSFVEFDKLYPTLKPRFADMAAMA